MPRNLRENGDGTGLSLIHGARVGMAEAVTFRKPVRRFRGLRIAIEQAAHQEAATFVAASVI
jgi:hypothetical protein